MGKPIGPSGAFRSDLPQYKCRRRTCDRRFRFCPRIWNGNYLIAPACRLKSQIVSAGVDLGFQWNHHFLSVRRYQFDSSSQNIASARERVVAVFHLPWWFSLAPAKHDNHHFVFDSHTINFRLAMFFRPCNFLNLSFCTHI